MATVLVADDSLVQLLTCSYILNSNGHVVVTVSDGRDAWESLQQQPFDLLISDILMPRMDGFELLTRVRRTASLSHMPVVLLTSLADEEQALAQQAVDASVILSKPISSWTLLDTVSGLLREY